MKTTKSNDVENSRKLLTAMARYGQIPSESYYFYYTLREKLRKGESPTNEERRELERIHQAFHQRDLYDSIRFTNSSNPLKVRIVRIVNFSLTGKLTTDKFSRSEFEEFGRKYYNSNSATPEKLADELREYVTSKRIVYDTIGYRTALDALRNHFKKREKDRFDNQSRR